MKSSQTNFEKGYHERFLYREQANSQRNQARLAWLLTLRQSGALLEIGCGTGGFLRLAQENFSVHGLDISRHAVQSLQAEFSERVTVGNIERQPLPVARYDVIVAFNILEHLRAPEKVAAKIIKSLRPGGLLIGSVPHNDTAVGFLVTRIGNLFDRTHVSTLPPDAWRRIFLHAGFSQVDFFGELNFGRNHCRYLRGSLWRYFAFNLMFACQV